MTLQTEYPKACAKYTGYNVKVPVKEEFIKFFNDANNLKPYPVPVARQSMWVVKAEPMAIPGDSRFMIPNVQHFDPDIEGQMYCSRVLDGKGIAQYEVVYWPMSWSDGGRFTYETADLNDAWKVYADCIHFDLALWESKL
jgi:hypothetical protein